MLLVNETYLYRRVPYIMKITGSNGPDFSAMSGGQKKKIPTNIRKLINIKEKYNCHRNMVHDYRTLTEVPESVQCKNSGPNMKFQKSTFFK